MKIVHALGWYFPESLGGTETYVEGLAGVLRARGHDVWIAAPDPGACESRTYVHDGSEVFRYSIPSRPTRAECRGEERVRGAEKLHEWLRRVRPDVFHCHSLVTGLGLPELEAARASGARVVVTFHTPGLGYLCQRGTMMRWGRELCDGLAETKKCAACELEHRGLPVPLAALAGTLPLSISRAASRAPGLGIAALIERNLARERSLFERTDAVVVLTEWARRAVERNLAPNGKLHLNRLGIAANRFQRSNRTATKPPFRFGYIGRPDAIKGVWVLAKAVARVPRGVDFTLEVRGPFRDEDRKRFRVWSKNDARVKFEPAVIHGEVAEVLAGLDVLICPSVALEGGPTVALEAHAVGTPVIGSRIGGLAEIVADGENGLLVTAGDEVALAQAIEQVARSDGRLVDAWRERLPRPRTMDDIADAYLQTYR